MGRGRSDRDSSAHDDDDRRAHIERKLRAELEAAFVEVIDESHLHAGHAGARSGGGHFRATIVSDRFAGLSSVAAQRLVYSVLAEEMQSAIHALSIKTLTPADWRSNGSAETSTD